MKEDIELLKKVLRFLNAVPDNKYGKNYTLASQLTKLINRLEKADLMEQCISLFETLKKDAEMALDGSWDCTTSEGIIGGFGAQIDLINELLPKLKTK